MPHPTQQRRRPPPELTGFYESRSTPPSTTTRPTRSSKPTRGRSPPRGVPDGDRRVGHRSNRDRRARPEAPLEGGDEGRPPPGSEPGTVAVGFLDPGHWSHCFGQSLIDLYLTDAFGSKRMVPHGKQLRDNARPAASSPAATRSPKFLDATECEWLFMVDSDMGFAPDTVDRLIASADPSSGPSSAACASRCAGHPRRVLRPEVRRRPHRASSTSTPTTEVGLPVDHGLPARHLFEVSGTGAACLLIHRTRAREAPRPQRRPLVRPDHPPERFDDLLRGSVVLRAPRRLRIPVHVDTRVRTTHDKHGVFLDEDEFDRCRALHAVPILKAASLFKRKDAPFGVAGINDFGPVRITRTDPDVIDLLRSFRRFYNRPEV
jgi:hypothetical protein